MRLLSALAMAFCLASASSAQDPAPKERRPLLPRDGKAPPAPPSFKEMLEKSDKDKDGAISKSEVDEKAWARIGRADADKDGKVTEKEYAAHRKSILDRAAGKRPSRGEKKGEEPAKDPKSPPA